MLSCSQRLQLSRRRCQDNRSAHALREHTSLLPSKLISRTMHCPRLLVPLPLLRFCKAFPSSTHVSDQLHSCGLSEVISSIHHVLSETNKITQKPLLAPVPFLFFWSLSYLNFSSISLQDGSSVTAAGWKTNCSTQTRAAHEKPTFGQLNQ